jgi:hypothetical protein
LRSLLYDYQTVFMPVSVPGAMTIIHTAGDLASFLHGRQLRSIEHARCRSVHSSEKEARIAAACIRASIMDGASTPVMGVE